MGKLFNFKCNISTFIKSVYAHRDKKTILFGAWMGEKFADNSRYLYQYLYLNKKKLGLNDVIWVTRNQSLNQKLNDLGYKSVVIGTKESEYWHLKSGIHILCNAMFPSEIFKPDIDIRYSFGAKKVQLWHGVGMKSVGSASNENVKNRSIIKRLFRFSNLDILFSMGGWCNEYFLSTSELNAKINIRISNCRKSKIIKSIYPRNCECLGLLEEEQNVINSINKYKYRVLYLPTFRNDYSCYKHPLEDSDLCSILKEQNICWIEKPHTASDFKLDKYKTIDNCIYLPADFDINVLYQYADFVISDYSSAVFDAVYKNIPIIMYAPDIDVFKNGDVGFLFDVDEYCKSIISHDLSSVRRVIQQIISGIYFSNERKETYTNIVSDFFENNDSNYERIWKDIRKTVLKM